MKQLVSRSAGAFAVVLAHLANSGIAASQTLAQTSVAKGLARQTAHGSARGETSSLEKRDSSGNPSAGATVNVDFGVPVPVKSGLGFLLGFDGDISSGVTGPDPPNGLILPLQPRYWRGEAIPSYYQRMRSLAPTAPIDLILSDSWGYPVDNWMFGGAPPWQNPAAYESSLESLLAPFVASTNTIFEVWNEPDSSDSWSGSTTQFYQTYLSAFQIIRNMLGSAAPVAGPSLSGYSHQRLTDFLEFCLANGCEVNSLTWHELDDASSIANIVADVQDARSSFLQNPRYAPLKIQRIDVNEIVGFIFTRQPAGTLAYYGALEKSGADAASHACWDDSSGPTCFNGTLDGLLTATFQPRAVWWLHKLYSDGVSQRVQAATSNTNVVALASSLVSGAGAAQVLIGNFSYDNTLSGSASPVNIQLVLNGLNFLPSAGPINAINLSVQLIPNSGDAALPQPMTVTQMTAMVSGNSAAIVLPPLQVGEVFRVTVSPVAPPSGNITLSPTTPLSFSYTSGGTVPAAQTVTVSTTSTSAVSFSAALSGSNCGWVILSPSSGSAVSGAPATLTLTPSPLALTGMAAGSYSCTLGVTPAGGTASNLSLNLTVSTPAISASPTSLTFSYLVGGATPAAQNVTVSGGSFTASASSTGNWLSVRPASGAAGATISVSVNPSGLSAGTYNGTVTVTGANGANGAGAVAVTLTVTFPPLPTVASVVNAASFIGGAISPGEIVTIGGTGLGPASPAFLTLDSNGNVTTAIGGVTVTFAGYAAPLTYVSSTQINAVVPYEVAGQIAPVLVVNYLGQTSNIVSLQTAAVVPGIFTQDASGFGPGAILNQDNTLNGPSRPAARGTVVQVFMTGEGKTTPTAVTGRVNNVSNPSQLPVPVMQPVSAVVGGQPAQVLFAGEAPGAVSGLLQVNVMIPASAAAGAQSIVILVGAAASQTQCSQKIGGSIVCGVQVSVQ